MRQLADTVRLYVDVLLLCDFIQHIILARVLAFLLNLVRLQAPCSDGFDGFIQRCSSGEQCVGVVRLATLQLYHCSRYLMYFARVPSDCSKLHLTVNFSNLSRHIDMISRDDS